MSGAITDPRVILARNAGARLSRRNRATRTTVTVYDGGEADLDTDGGRWTVVCEDHGTTLCCETMTCARESMSVPYMWCEDCQALYYGAEK